ncbi:MAG: hypothetical protein ACLFQV_02925 [Vulcanimicrobiota bacterium]
MKEFTIEGHKLPALILGSSPFCGAGQFGSRARDYQKQFYHQPQNITDLIIHFISRGYHGLHLLALAPIVKATLEAYRKLGEDFPVIVTLMPQNEEEQWKWIKKLNTKIVFLHGAETDKMDMSLIEEFARNCRKNCVVPGVATHNTGITIPAIDKNRLDIQAYLCPFNKTGLHVHPSLKEALKAISETEKAVIGMKILSCGELTPDEAFPFSLPYVDAITVGMVTNNEVDENCKFFEKFAHTLASKRRIISS